MLIIPGGRGSTSLATGQKDHRSLHDSIGISVLHANVMKFHPSDERSTLAGAITANADFREEPIHPIGEFEHGRAGDIRV